MTLLRRGRRAPVAVAATALTCLAGCGSTVAGSALGNTDGAGLVGPGGAGASGLTAGGAGAVPGNGNGATGSPASLGAGSSRIGGAAAFGNGKSGRTWRPGTPSALTPAVAGTPGITATKIYLGTLSSSQSAQADSAAGLSGASPRYDTRDLINVAVKYANTHGGFAGRELDVVNYDVSLTADQNTELQAACTYWTQDHHVFAMIAGPDELDACAEKVHAVPLGSGSEEQLRRFPHMVNPDGITLDRLAAVTVTGLDRASYFTGKLGLVTWDDPAYRAAITHGYLPQLARRHITADQVAYVTVPQQMGALGDSTASVSSAIAKFKSLGIDHVIVQDGPAGVYGGTGLTLEWMNAADSQRYYPRYGQNAMNSPGWNLLPADQMDKAIAIDNQDYDPMFDTGWHTNAARTKCFKMMSEAGYPQDSSNPNDESDAEMACDLVFFLQQAINSAPVLSADTFVQAVSRFGTSFHSAAIYGTNLFPGRRDGADMFRTEEYLASCKCLRYKGPPYYAN